ncbi:hypothetical protein SHELI_v1c04800 [Spiroplasma helicoides]|uniref:Uncharacterized protein n=1 Tax=Spiroplasma helicoides TaxID=216938 RepID=A0A1B3SKH1_9MOLU|nr:hypothetical protein [Spiroplasma helicoides]AOG60431.1 hypothetical protein SHELI_v1c04800 [Spiroplasma helicoides]
MNKILAFHLKRTLKDKLFIGIVLSVSIVMICVILWMCIITSQAVYTIYVWGPLLIVFWILNICYINLVCISNAMVEDRHNGILDLEISKGYNHGSILVCKLITSKIISISYNVIMIGFFYLNLLIMQPDSKYFFENVLFYGFLSFFALDWLTMGIFVLFSSFKISRIVFCLAGIYTGLMSLSPILGGVQQTFSRNKFQGINESRTTLSAQYFQILLDFANSQKGILNKLLNNMYTLNDDYRYDLKWKTNSKNNDCLSSGYICLYNSYYKGEEFTESVSRYGKIASLGLMLDSEYFLNNSKSSNSNYEFKLFDSYKQNIVYKFLKSSLKESKADNLTSTYFYKRSQKNITGSNQYNDYCKYIIQDNVVNNIISSLNLEATKDQVINEIKTLNDILYYYYQDFWVVNDNRFLDMDNKNWQLIFRNFNNNSTIDNSTKMLFVSERDLYDNALLKDGNRLYMALLFDMIDNLMYYPDFIINGGIFFGYDYETYQKNPGSYRQYFLSNPLYFQTFMLMYTNKNQSLKENKFAMQLSPFDHLPLKIVKYEKNENYEYIDLYNWKFGEKNTLYNKYENIGIKNVFVTENVINVDYVYIGYFVLGVLFLTAGYLIYRKLTLI